MSEPVFILKVALAGDSNVWRRIAVRADQTLDDLHWAIYDAFDRYDEHLYSFYFLPPGRTSRRLRAGTEYACPLKAERGPVADAGETQLGDLGLRRRRKFRYLFDYGDEWWHVITVEQTDAPAEKGQYPRIVEEHGKSPPQYEDWDEKE